jgi:hypothetical protein
LGGGWVRDPGVAKQVASDASSTGRVSNATLANFSRIARRRVAIRQQLPDPIVETPRQAQVVRFSKRSPDACLPALPLSFIQTREKEIIVKKSNLTLGLMATVLTLSATVASAQVTRAEVKAQLQAAEASGQLAALTGEDSGSAYLASHFHSTESRGEVKDEVKEARADGSLNALDGSDSGSFYLSQHETLDTPRAEVRSELAAAEKNGTLDQLYGEDSGSFELAAEQHRGAAHAAVASN